MKLKNRLPLVILILIAIGFFCLFSAPLNKCLAEQNQLVFQKDTYYDIYYALQNHVQYITNVKIIDVVMIGGVTFLEIQSSNISTDKGGYISFSSIVAILPTGSLRPQVLK
jgi:hypothetical protein